MNKAYSRINWVNKPDHTTPISATNLNVMDSALDTIDDRVVALDSDKADASSVPTQLSQLTADATHRTVTDTEKSTWNGKSTVSFSQTQHTGTEVGEITINGTTTKLFAPNGGSGGGGDMLASTYDPNGDVANAGGIPAYVSTHSGGGSNENLLDNAWFTVNTTGATSWTVGSSSVEIFDRIRAYGGTLALSNNELTLTASSNSNGILQRFSGRPFQGKTFTLSVMLSDGTIYSHTVTDAGTEYTVSSNPTVKLAMGYNASSNITQTYISTGNGESITVKAMKLELGSVSTLDKDLPPNYNDELLKCNNPYPVIATEEYGSTSSKAYAIGEYFIRGGKMCKCTQAIASGGTFTKNTNYIEVDVGSQITATNTALSGKQDALTFTSTPSASNKVVCQNDLPSNATITGSFTFATDFSGSSNVKQYGNVVSVNLIVSILKNTSEGSYDIGTLSGVTLPPIHQNAFGTASLLNKSDSCRATILDVNSVNNVIRLINNGGTFAYGDMAVISLTYIV